MAEPPATTPPKVVASQQDVLLATKLHMPRPQPGTVPRPRLVDRLDEALARGLVLVCAPAGFGKTSLLADWAHRSPLPVAWLSLDEGDNDPARFWRHVVAALDRARPGIADRVAGLLGPPPPPSFEGLVTALINELAAEPGRGADHHQSAGQRFLQPLNQAGPGHEALLRPRQVQLGGQHPVQPVGARRRVTHGRLSHAALPTHRHAPRDDAATPAHCRSSPAALLQRLRWHLRPPGGPPPA